MRCDIYLTCIIVPPDTGRTMHPLSAHVNILCLKGEKEDMILAIPVSLSVTKVSDLRDK